MPGADGFYSAVSPFLLPAPPFRYVLGLAVLPATDEPRPARLQGRDEHDRQKLDLR